MLCVQEHKLMRNQSMAGSKLADLSEASEQEKGNSHHMTSCPRTAFSIFNGTPRSAAQGVHFLNLKKNMFFSKMVMTVRMICSCGLFSNCVIIYCVCSEEEKQEKSVFTFYQQVA